MRAADERRNASIMITAPSGARRPARTSAARRRRRCRGCSRRSGTRPPCPETAAAAPARAGRPGTRAISRASCGMRAAREHLQLAEPGRHAEVTLGSLRRRGAVRPRTCRVGRWSASDRRAHRRRPARGAHRARRLQELAGAEGFEPSNTGSKVPRLTAWPRPISPLRVLPRARGRRPAAAAAPALQRRAARRPHLEKGDLSCRTVQPRSKP